MFFSRQSALNLTRRIWADPVWSKVIAAAIVACGSSVYVGSSLIRLLIIVGFLVLWTVCVFVRYSKEQSRVFSLNASYTVFRFGRSVRRFGTYGIFVLPLALLIWILAEQLPSGRIKILVADFDEEPSQNYRVTRNIYDAISMATKGYPAIEVQLLSEHIKESSFARSIGKEKNASLVLWGSYGKTSQSVQVSVNFETLKPLHRSAEPPGLVLPCGEESIIKSFTASAGELETFALQVDLAHQLSALSLVAIGIANYRDGNYDESIDLFTKALGEWGTVGPVIDVAEIHFLRAISYLKKDDPDQALSEFATVVRLKPSHANAYNNRGSVYLQKGDMPMALADYTESIRIGTGQCLPCAYTSRGFIYSSRGDLSDAIADFSQAIELNPDLAEAYEQRGYAYLHMNRYDEAIADYAEAIRLRPENPCYFNGRGYAYSIKKDFALAIADYSKAISLDRHVTIFSDTPNLR